MMVQPAVKSYEVRLADNVVISVARVRRDDGSLDYDAVIQATTLDGDGDTVHTRTIPFSVLVENQVLSATDVDAMKQQAAKIVTALASLLGVQES